MIVDRLQILFKSGSGGRGSSSVKKLSAARFIPDGGDGGRGADIILRVSPHLYDLSKLKGKKKISAPFGEPGSRRLKSGKNAEPLYIDLPRGTQVLDENKQLVVDLVRDKEEFILCAGGHGGRGSNRNPATNEPGRGQSRLVILDYRIPADLAILGVANTQKTTLFNLLTGQQNRVAHYPFTTATCAFSHFSFNFKKITVLDTPPLREAKDDFKKNRFLRHLFRVKIILILGKESDVERAKEEISKFRAEFVKNKKVFYLPDNVGKMNINQLQEKVYNYLENN